VRKKLKSLISKHTPLSIKKSLFNIWNEDDDGFWLYCKMVLNENGDLFKNRFLWTDLDLPIETIKGRFGANQKIFLLTDRLDYPNTMKLDLLKIEDLTKLKSDVNYAVICAFESDEKLLHALKIIAGKSNIFYYSPHRYLPTARYFHRNDGAKRVLISELNLKRGKFDLADFENIIQALEITRKIKGDYIEIGVYKGDSAHAALHYMKESNINRKSYFFDLFEGFTNESSQQSGDASWLNSHTDTSMQYVEQYLSEYDNFTISKLDVINDDLPASIKEIALCNLDVDLYEAIKAGLSKVAPLIVRGGIIILEDQGHTPFLAGAFLATMEFLHAEGNDFAPIHLASGQMFLIKL
jgi:hypothetical protein